MLWSLAYVRSLAALVLLVASIGKIANRTAFRQIVANYELVPDDAVKAIARFLPEVEALVACMLLTWLSTTYAAILAASLFVSFALAIGTNLARGRSSIACGCFGAYEYSPLSWGHMLINLLFAVAVILSIPGLWGQIDVSALPLVDRLSAILSAGVTFVCWWLGTMSLRAWRRTLVDV